MDAYTILGNLLKQREIDWQLQLKQREQELQLQVEYMRQQVTDMDEQLKQREGQIAGLKNQLGGLETQLTVMQFRANMVESMVTQLDQAKERTRKLGELMGQRVEMVGLRQQLRDNEKHMKWLEQRHDGLLEKYVDMRNKLDDAQYDLVQARMEGAGRAVANQQLEIAVQRAAPYLLPIAAMGSQQAQDNVILLASRLHAVSSAIPGKIVAEAEARGELSLWVNLAWCC